MPTDQRRAAARRRAWGRGPMILRFEPLEERQLLSTAAATLPDLKPAAFHTVQNLAWGDTFHATGQVLNAGAGTVAKSFVVNIYAASTAGPGPNEVLLGQVTIPGNLASGQSASFDQLVSLPATPLAGMGQTGNVYIGDKIDSAGAIKEASTALQTVAGPGFDLSAVTIAPHQPASLVGASLSAYPAQPQWGTAFQLTAQIKNAGLGDAPPTRARVVLTPAGQAVGGPYDVTVDNIAIPAIAAGQTAIVTKSVMLPGSPPSTLAGSTQFILSLAEDADYVTNQVTPHAASQGIGYDMFALTISTARDARSLSSAKPQLDASSLVGPSQKIALGQAIQVDAQVVNTGSVAAPAFSIRYLLVGTNGSLDQSIYLGDFTYNGGLAANTGTNITQILHLPTTLPAGMTLNASSVARIAMVVDPEHVIDQASRTPNIVTSNVVTVSSTPVTPTTAATAALTATAAKATSTKATSTKAPPAVVKAKKVAKSPVKQKHTLAHNVDVLPNHFLKYVKRRLKIK